jgi:hypothetical protein
MGSARRLELGTGSSRAPVGRVLVAKLRPLGETVGLSRARTSGESPDSTQAGRGPQWPTQLAVSMRREVKITQTVMRAMVSMIPASLTPASRR